ncbi:MAG: nickel-dependent lactate racemase [Desulfuromonadales bacterium]|jgi:nickel-dependent lactate racemase|nr:nickel-dependent lactate racemase [Desulfuromonadales bacterium]
MAKVSLKYGAQALQIDLQAQLLTAAAPQKLPDPTTELRRALANPLGSPPLAKLVKPGEHVVIVTSDITRYTASEIYLPLLVEELNHCGVSDHNIEIVIALGIHRKQTAAEHKKILGPLYGRIAVHDHECDDPQQLVDLSTTSSGLPVQINRRVIAADRVIVTGTIGLHYFAGYGGGRKSLVPGVASRTTCMATHFAIFNPPEQGGRNTKARTANLDGNPVHQAILEAAKMIKPDFLLNTVLTTDKQIARVFCGDLEQAHLAGCALAQQLYTAPLEQPVDLAIVSCGGHPKDINFIQAHKALDYGVQAVRPGGTVILLAACPDGFGNATFFDWFNYEDLDLFEKALRSRYEINGQTAWSTLSKARSWRVILVSEFDRGQTEKMGMEKANTLDEALQMAYKQLPESPEIVVIPDGGTILPVISQP